MNIALEKFYKDNDHIIFADLYELEALAPIIRDFTPTTMSLREIVDTFPEGIAILKKYLPKHKKELKICEETGKKIFNLFLEGLYLDTTLTENSREFLWIPFGKWYFFDRICDPVRHRIKEAEQMIKMSQMQQLPQGQNSHHDLERAKNYPLATLVTLNHAGFAPCPFHKEKTGSMKVYKDNRFHCFGCGKDGDVIDFVMNRDGVNFQTAVQILNNN